MAQQPAGAPPWYESNQRIAAVYADLGKVNAVTGSPLGPLLEVGGAVDLNAAAGPNGLPGFRFNAGSGGHLEFTNTSPQTFQPCTLNIVCRFRTAVANGVMACRPSTNIGVFLGGAGVNQARMTALNLAGGFLSPAYDPTQWHLLTCFFGATVESCFSLDGGSYTFGDPTAAQFGGLSIGGGSSAGVQADLDVYAVEFTNGRMSPAQQRAFCAQIRRKTGITVAAPPAYTPPEPLWPPQLAARPARWPAVNPTIYFQSIGQSNDVGYSNTAPIVAISSAVSMMNLRWQVKAAAIPLQEAAAGYKNPISGDGSQSSGYQNRACNTIAAALGRDVTISVDSKGGTSSALWLPTAAPVPSCLFYAAVTKMQEAVYWGQELGGVFVCQGEADTDGPTWLANWQLIIAKFRAILGRPNLPFFFTQTPSPAGVRTYEPNISDPANKVYFIPSTLSANLQPSGNLHWTATGYDLAGQALAAQVLAGWPYV